MEHGDLISCVGCFSTQGPLFNSAIRGICECFEVTYQLHRGACWLGGREDLGWVRALDSSLDLLTLSRTLSVGKGRVHAVARRTYVRFPKGPSRFVETDKALFLQLLHLKSSSGVVPWIVGGGNSWSTVGISEFPFSLTQYYKATIWPLSPNRTLEGNLAGGTM